MTSRERITEQILQVLSENQDGIRYSDLIQLVQQKLPEEQRNTVIGTIVTIDKNLPEKVYKPSRGLYKLTQFRPETPKEDILPEPEITTADHKKILESDFYEPFAEWLVNEMEDCTNAISLGGNKFGGKWGTPDVVGIKRPKEFDIIKSTIEVVSVEIKLNTSDLITAFGQACSYRLFSHKVYLVIPQQSLDEDISRLDSLCDIFGIGLIKYDITNKENPNFQILNRPRKSEPDYFYANANIEKIKEDLF